MPSKSTAKEETQAFDEAISAPQTSIEPTTESQITKPMEGNLTMRGATDISMSEIPLPVVKMVHPTTKDAVDAQGEDVAPGYYLNTQTGEARKELEFYVLRVRNGWSHFKDATTGEGTDKKTFFILGADAVTMQPFLMRVTGAGYYAFAKMLGALHGKQTPNMWDYKLTAGKEKKEGDHGVYLASTFTLGEGTSMKDKEILEGLFNIYGASLDQQGTEEKDVTDNSDDGYSKDIPF